MLSNQFIVLKTGRLRNQAYIFPFPIQTKLPDKQLVEKGKFLFIEMRGMIEFVYYCLTTLINY